MDGGGRRRARSQHVRPENPLLTPITEEEQQLARLRGSILIAEREKEKERGHQRANLQESGGWQGTALSRTQGQNVDVQVVAAAPQLVSKNKLNGRAAKTTNPLPPARSPERPRVPNRKPTDPFPQFIETMNNNYEYLASPVSSQSGSQPRSAPPSPGQNMAHTNGMNGGGMGIGNGMVGYPTPAGHQSDLNYVMSMVEELSQVLRANQALTESVVEKMGQVRERAQNQNLTNDEMIAVVAKELNEDSKNLEKENSELRKALEKSEYHRKENFKLACHGANILADVTEKLHRFKEQHESDTLAWHKNYRKQLADEREENLTLRNQINDMKAAACRANESLRDMRRYVTDNSRRHELEVQNIQFRQERRFYKRMAFPLIPDDDSEWSDDDDLVDPEEKKRLAAEARAKEQKRLEEAEGGEVSG